MTPPNPLLIIILCCLLVAAVPVRAADNPAPGVLVTSVAAQPVSTPDLIEAYGTAMPASNGTQTLSVMEAGRVVRILVSPGMAVARGAPVLEWEQSSAARQAWEQARTSQALAAEQRTHAVLLLEHHLGTRDQLDHANKALADAQAAVDALKRTGADQPKRILAAPSDGIILTTPINQGETVAAGTPLAMIVPSGGSVVTVGIDPARRLQLRLGQTATLTPLDGGVAIAGMILRFDAVLNPRTRLVNADLAVAPASTLLGAGYRVEIAVGRLDGWRIPHDAVLQDGSGTYLFQAEGSRAIRVPVKVLRVQDGADIVAGALDPSRKVIVDGAYQLSSGAGLREAAPP